MAELPDFLKEKICSVFPNKNHEVRVKLSHGENIVPLLEREKKNKKISKEDLAFIIKQVDIAKRFY